MREENEVVDRYRYRVGAEMNGRRIWEGSNEGKEREKGMEEV